VGWNHDPIHRLRRPFGDGIGDVAISDAVPVCGCFEGSGSGIPIDERFEFAAVDGEFGAGPVLPEVPKIRVNLVALPVEDTKYLATLDAGHVPYTSRQTAIVTGDVICTGLRAGDSYLYTTAVVGGMNPSYSEFQVGYVIGAAVGAYCPDQQDNVPHPSTP
jgi:hypothetical protein